MKKHLSKRRVVVSAIVVALAIAGGGLCVLDKHRLG